MKYYHFFRMKFTNHHFRLCLPSRNATTMHRYSRSSCCWNCKAQGHIASECNQEKQLFCSYCLKDGVTTRNCNCRSVPRQAVTYRVPPLADNDIRKYPECYWADTSRDQPMWLGVGDEVFRTYIDTSRKQSSVGWLVCTKASIFYGIRREFKRTDEGIISEATIPLRCVNTIRTLRCRITEEEEDVIRLGGDALQCFGFKMFLADSHCLGHPGCPDISHKSVYDIPIPNVVAEKPRKRPKTSVKPKNPIDLSLGDMSEVETTRTPEISEIVNTPLMIPEFDPANRRWEKLILEEAQDEPSKETMDHVMALPEAEIDEYLRLDADLMDVEKLQ